MTMITNIMALTQGDPPFQNTQRLLNKAMSEKGVDPAEVSHRVNVSKAEIERWCAGTAKPAFPQIMAMIEVALGLEYGQIRRAVAADEAGRDPEPGTRQAKISNVLAKRNQNLQFDGPPDHRLYKEMAGLSIHKCARLHELERTESWRVRPEDFKAYPLARFEAVPGGCSTTAGTTGQMFFRFFGWANRDASSGGAGLEEKVLTFGLIASDPELPIRYVDSNLALGGALTTAKLFLERCIALVARRGWITQQPEYFGPLCGVALDEWAACCERACQQFAERLRAVRDLLREQLYSRHDSTGPLRIALEHDRPLDLLLRVVLRMRVALTQLRSPRSRFTLMRDIVMLELHILCAQRPSTTALLEYSENNDGDVFVNSEGDFVVCIPGHLPKNPEGQPYITQVPSAFREDFIQYVKVARPGLLKNRTSNRFIVSRYSKNQPMQFAHDGISKRLRFVTHEYDPESFPEGVAANSIRHLIATHVYQQYLEGTEQAAAILRNAPETTGRYYTHATEQDQIDVMQRQLSICREGWWGFSVGSHLRNARD